MALDTHVSDELLLEGMARELISRVQKMRRDAALDVTDRITLTWSSDDDVINSAIATHEPEIAAEVLAVSIAEGGGESGESFEIDGRAVSIQIVSAARS